MQQSAALPTGGAGSLRPTAGPTAGSTTGPDALRTAAHRALAAYRRADDERLLLTRMQSVRPWTAGDEARAAAAAQEARLHLDEFARLSRELDRLAPAA
jgi:hypothetical protein